MAQSRARVPCPPPPPQREEIPSWYGYGFPPTPFTDRLPPRLPPTLPHPPFLGVILLPLLLLQLRLGSPSRRRPASVGREPATTAPHLQRRRVAVCGEVGWPKVRVLGCVFLPPLWWSCDGGANARCSVWEVLGPRVWEKVLAGTGGEVVGDGERSLSEAWIAGELRDEEQAFRIPRTTIYPALGGA